jgi:4-hydroxyacetophenone monooxygenase
MIECQVTYIVSCLKGLIESGGTSMSCRDEPMAKYHNYIYKELGKKVWATDCKSWYKNEKGIIFVLWPNGTIEYWWKLLSCNLADYKLKY